MTHFLAIDHDIESDRVYGVYGSLQEATTDLDNRTIDKKLIEDQARANREKSGQIGDPGPYVDIDEYGVDRADIEEWEGRHHIASWERRTSERTWRETWRRAQSIQK